MRPAIPQRLAAYSIDFTVAYVCVWATFAAFRTMIQEVFQLPLALESAIFNSLREWTWPLSLWALFSYLFYCNYFRQGKSLGCICLDFTILSKQRRELTLRESLVRSGLQALAPIALGTVIYAPLLLIPLIRKDRQGVADIFSGSHSYLDQYIRRPLTLASSQDYMPESPTTEEQQRAA